MNYISPPASVYGVYYDQYLLNGHFNILYLGQAYVFDQ